MKKQNGGKREGAGRKSLSIDWATIDKLLMISCTGEEIASFLGVNYDTIVNHCRKEKQCEFSDYIKSGINKTFRVSLRRAQRTMAMGMQDNDGNWIEKPNVSMLIWLGKQYLDQKDKTDMDMKTSIGLKDNENIVKLEIDGKDINLSK